MLYYIFYSLRDYWFGFNVFKYITFRAAMASVTALLISLIFGPVIIGWLKKVNFGQYIRKEHVESLYDLLNKQWGSGVDYIVENKKDESDKAAEEIKRIIEGKNV